MSDLAPEHRALKELESLVRHLADELAAFRRRALVAESRLKDVESSDGGLANLELAQRVATLLSQQADYPRAIDVLLPWGCPER